MGVGWGGVGGGGDGWVAGGEVRNGTSALTCIYMRRPSSYWCTHIYI